MRALLATAETISCSCMLAGYHARKGHTRKRAAPGTGAALLLRRARGSAQADLGARLLELGLGGVGGVLGNGLEDRLRSALDEVLRLLEAEAGDELADDLDDLDLLVAGCLEDDVELVLLLGRFRSGTRAGRAGHHGHRGGRGD